MLQKKKKSESIVLLLGWNTQPCNGWGTSSLGCVRKAGFEPFLFSPQKPQFVMIFVHPAKLLNQINYTLSLCQGSGVAPTQPRGTVSACPPHTQDNLSWVGPPARPPARSRNFLEHWVEHQNAHGEMSLKSKWDSKTSLSASCISKSCGRPRSTIINMVIISRSPIPSYISDTL